MDLEALHKALEASPENIPLLLMVATEEENMFGFREARSLLDRVLAIDPQNSAALLGIARLLDFMGKSSEGAVRVEDLCNRQPDYAPAWLLRARITLDEGDGHSARTYYDKAVALDRSLADDELLGKILSTAGPKRSAATSSGSVHEFDDYGDDDDEDDFPFEGLDAAAAHDLGIDFSVKTNFKFTDVGGMEKVKEDIRMKIIHPLKNPGLFAAYGKKAGGGVLLYGPPGCGKTLMAQATAGEIESTFLAVGLHQILDMYIGESEQKLHRIFELARRLQAGRAVLR